MGICFFQACFCHESNQELSHYSYWYWISSEIQCWFYWNFQYLICWYFWYSWCFCFDWSLVMDMRYLDWASVSISFSRSFSTFSANCSSLSCGAHGCFQWWLVYVYLFINLSQCHLVVHCLIGTFCLWLLWCTSFAHSLRQLWNMLGLRMGI
jgi:hypothetical protein